jgi:hypothetical protein
MIRAVDQRIHKLHTVRRLMRHYAKTHEVSARRQIAEIFYLWARNGIGPLEYYLLGLFRPAVPWREKLNTVSGAWYEKAVQQINPLEKRVIATNKIATSLLLQSFDIPTPKIHGVLDRTSGLTFDGARLRDAADLGELIKHRSLTHVCMKPINAWSGRGFVKLEFQRNADAIRAHVEPSGPTLTLEALCGGYLDETRYGSFLVQDVVEQHPEVARLHPTSLNTIRAWMHQPEPDRWEMFCANLRMGVDEMTIDNNSAGGIGAVIDVETGRMGLAVRRGLDPERGVMLREYAVHPTTGVRIEGEILPTWPEVLSLCRGTCPLFPFFGFMALDVGIGKDHPWIVEVEADPHSTIQVHCGKGLRPMLEPLLSRSRSRGT